LIAGLPAPACRLVETLTQFRRELDTLALVALGNRLQQSSALAIASFEQLHRFSQDGVGVGIWTGFDLDTDLFLDVGGNLDAHASFLQ
jgi:hypothetical protein